MLCKGTLISEAAVLYVGHLSIASGVNMCALQPVQYSTEKA